MEKQPVYFNCIAFQMSLAKRKISDFYEQQLTTLGLTPSYVYVLEILHEHGPLSLSKIAQLLQLEKASVSTLLGRMERDEFLVRMQGKERRTLSVQITEKGNSILQKALQVLVDADTELNKKLGGELEAIKQMMFQVNELL